MLTSVIRTVGVLLFQEFCHAGAPRRFSEIASRTAGCSSHPGEAVVRRVRALPTARARTEGSRRASHATRERRAEAPQTPVANLQADLGHRQRALAEQCAGPRHPRLALERVRRCAEHGAEAAQEPGIRQSELATEGTEWLWLLAAITQPHPQVAESTPGL